MEPERSQAPADAGNPSGNPSSTMNPTFTTEEQRRGFSEELMSRFDRLAQDLQQNTQEQRQFHNSTLTAYVREQRQLRNELAEMHSQQTANMREQRQLRDQLAELRSQQIATQRLLQQLLQSQQRPQQLPGVQAPPSSVLTPTPLGQELNAHPPLYQRHYNPGIETARQRFSRIITDLDPSRLLGCEFGRLLVEGAMTNVNIANALLEIHGSWRHNPASWVPPGRGVPRPTGPVVPGMNAQPARLCHVHQSANRANTAAATPGPATVTAPTPAPTRQGAQTASTIAAAQTQATRTPGPATVTAPTPAPTRPSAQTASTITAVQTQATRTPNPTTITTPTPAPTKPSAQTASTITTAQAQATRTPGPATVTAPMPAPARRPLPTRRPTPEALASPSAAQRAGSSSAQPRARRPLPTRRPTPEAPASPSAAQRTGSSSAQPRARRPLPTRRPTPEAPASPSAASTATLKTSRPASPELSPRRLRKRQRKGE